LLSKGIIKYLALCFLAILTALIVLSAAQAFAITRYLSVDNRDYSCRMSVSVKKIGSMSLTGTLHEYPRSGFCCVAQPLALKYKDSKVNQFMKQAIKAALSEPPNYNRAIANLDRVLKITNLPDAKRALFAAKAAQNGAVVSQFADKTLFGNDAENSTNVGGCSLSWGQWLWVRITGTGDTFGRF
jgi:hypothetical protein